MSQSGIVSANASAMGFIDQIQVDAATAPGTDPVVPTAGVVTVTGGQVASGTVGANVTRTHSTAASQFRVEIQRAGSAAATDSTLNGVCHFDNTDFTIDANGFVSLLGTGALETLTGDSGTANPVAGNINILTDVGLTSVGATDDITISLDGASEGTGQTVGAVTADLITVALGATPTTYQFFVQVAGFESTTPASIGGTISITVRTTGAAAVIAGSNIDTQVEAALAAGAINVVASANNAIVRVTGVAGLTIDWRAFSTFRRVA